MSPTPKRRWIRRTALGLVALAFPALAQDRLAVDPAWRGIRQPVAQVSALQQVCSELKGRPARMKLVFAGPASADKLRAAQVLGRELGRTVYRIDLSEVVSKYAGEVEKNLDRLLARAEGKNWILFFDEADALFGKRTRVADAHDRYANQEVSYLLQRIEAYDGLVILATNFGARLTGLQERKTIAFEGKARPDPDEKESGGLPGTPTPGRFPQGCRPRT
jgi:hypothetical protein